MKAGNRAPGDAELLFDLIRKYTRSFDWELKVYRERIWEWMFDAEVSELGRPPAQYVGDRSDYGPGFHHFGREFILAKAAMSVSPDRIRIDFWMPIHGFDGVFKRPTTKYVEGYITFQPDGEDHYKYDECDGAWQISMSVNDEAQKCNKKIQTQVTDKFKKQKEDLAEAREACAQMLKWIEDNGIPLDIYGQNVMARCKDVVAARGEMSDSEAKYT